jgi:hypothetical protein
MGGLCELLAMSQDERVDQRNLAGRAGPEAPSPRSQQPQRRRAVILYLAATAAVLIALTAADIAAIGLKVSTAGADSADKYSDSIGYCAVMLGIAYYLGRTRNAPGNGKQLNRLGRIISVIPVWALIQIPYFGGLDRSAKRRLCIRNIAITAGSVLVWSLWTDLRSAVTGPVIAMAVLQVGAIALAVVMCRRMPAAGLPPAGMAPLTADDTSRSQAGPPAEMPDGIPPADKIIDVSPLAADARRLYWLTGSLKFDAIFLAVPVLAEIRPLSVGTACAAIVAAFAIAMLIQEDWIRPATGLALALALTSAACFVPVAFGVIGSNDVAALIGWAISAGLFLWLYLRQRRSSGLTDAEVQAASRVGHLPRRQAGLTFHRLAPRLWIRGGLGLVCAIPVVVAGLVNTIFSPPLISGWIQSALDKLYALARDSVDVWLAGARSEERIITALVMPPEPGMWQLSVRGDMLRTGKFSIPLLSPLIVPFGEFLRTRLEVYGEVQMIDETPAGPEAESAERSASMVVMPVDVSYSANILNQVAALGTRMPLLLVAQSIGKRPLGSWPLLASQMRDRGIALPVIDDPVRTIAVLAGATCEKTIYLAPRRDQWGYMAAIYEAFGAISARTRTARAQR